MLAREECFLARPAWRGLDRAPVEKSAYGSEATALKLVMSNLMLDFPEMIREAADLVRTRGAKHGQRDYDACLEGVLRRQFHMKTELEMWLNTVSLKTGTKVGAQHDQTPPSKQRYRNLFCGIVDCIVNSVLAKLDRMLLRLGTLVQPTPRIVLGLQCGPDTLQGIEARKATAMAALAFVKSTSDIGTKPLDLGLKMIATDDDLFEVPGPPGVEELSMPLRTQIQASSTA